MLQLGPRLLMVAVVLVLFLLLCILSPCICCCLCCFAGSSSSRVADHEKQTATELSQRRFLAMANALLAHLQHQVGPSTVRQQ